MEPEVIDVSPQREETALITAIANATATGTTQLSHRENTGFLGMEPEAMVAYATRVANVLKPIITQQNLSIDLSNGRGQPHVKVDGWITLGSLLGILPKEERVIRHDNGTYEASVSLVRQSDGRVISSASSLCGIDERTWKSRDEYARRSMAVTRATGKAYRLSFGWIMHLAGYNPTPAEEMPSQGEEIPFGNPEEEIYSGTHSQKQTVQVIFKELGVSDVDTMREISASLVKAKLPMKTVKDAVTNFNKIGIIKK